MEQIHAVREGVKGLTPQEQVREKEKLIKDLKYKLSSHLYIEILMVATIFLVAIRYYQLRKAYELRPGGFVA